MGCHGLCPTDHFGYQPEGRDTSRREGGVAAVVTVGQLKSKVVCEDTDHGHRPRKL